MSTEVIGYLAMPQRTAQKPTERLTEQRKIKAIQILDTIAKTLVSVIMLELAALSIPIADGDCTGALMASFLVIINLIGGKSK